MSENLQIKKKTVKQIPVASATWPLVQCRGISIKVQQPTPDQFYEADLMERFFVSNFKGTRTTLESHLKFIPRLP